MQESVTFIYYQGEEAMLGSVFDISERKQAEEQLRYLSFRDKLTGLYNRAFFDEELARYDTPRQLPLSVIIADLNGLKLVNDLMGHEAGDKTIQKTALLLQENCREEDIICRWGGDEFAILLPRTPAWAAEKISRRIKEASEETSDDELVLSLSVGVATKEEPLWDARQASQDVHELLSEAEDRMYRQKLLDTHNLDSFVPQFLLNSLAEKTQETREHVNRLEKLCTRMGKALELPLEQVDRLVLLCRLHDLGKMAVPDTVLSKPGPLRGEEWEMMKRHSEVGAKIVRSVPAVARVADEIHAHHERFDGGGYPRGLRGAQIPLLARILAISDAYDVMTNGRCYQDPVPLQEALAELRRCSGSQFDPRLVETFIGILESDIAGNEDS